MSAELEQRALAVLSQNSRGSWTCPARGIYPHQWLWDSAFVAIGLAGHDPDRAAAEIVSIFRGQWSNGMVPHMIFAGDADLGSRRLWRSRHDPRAPREVDTSCITQPPVLAIAAWFVARELDRPARDRFLTTVVPKLVAYHRWLYRERDPRASGLITLIHPWECGLDTTPPWMHAMRRLRPSAWLRIVNRLGLARLVRRIRRDTRYAPAAERGRDDDALRMLDLARRAERHRFDLDRLPPAESLLVHDVGFNGLLAVANEKLESLAAESEHQIPTDLVERFRSTDDALEDLWDGATATYCSREALSHAPLRPDSIAAYAMLWAGHRPDRLAKLLDRLRSDDWQPPHPVPSIATDAADFDARRYWSGPTWINTNWIVIQGLRRTGETGLAEMLREQTLQLVTASGFAEYFSPLDGAPLGASDFSWSAALTLALCRPDDAS
jgi:hypothetical protein